MNTYTPILCIQPCKGIRVAMRFLSIVIAAMSAIVFTPATVADVDGTLPDFYNAPGLNPNGASEGEFNDVVDPFSGTLNISHTDLVVPGKGGLDIAVQRTYSSGNIWATRSIPGEDTSSIVPPRYPFELQQRRHTGEGWTLHFGRVGRSQNICSIESHIDGTTDNNPVLELSDGRQMVFYQNDTPQPWQWVSEERWSAKCDSTNPNNGLLVYAPGGTEYRMDHYVSGGGGLYSGSPVDYWYTSRITDRNGNYFDISYEGGNLGWAYLKDIVAEDGRIVNFNYLPSRTDPNAYLSTIEANGQLWEYQYTQDGGRDYLTKVIRPDGLEWNYSYYLAQNDPAADQKMINTVTYPYGGTSTYTFGFVNFYGDPFISPWVDPENVFYSHVVKTRTLEGRDVVPATWTYTYNPASGTYNSNTQTWLPYDETIVEFPGGKTVYQHVSSFADSSAPVWFWDIGLLLDKKDYDVVQIRKNKTEETLVSHEEYEWYAGVGSPNMILLSEEDYKRPPYNYTITRGGRPLFN